MTKKNSFAKRWSEWIVKKRLLVLGLSVALLVAAGSGVTKLSVSSDYRYFFQESNPQRLIFEKLQNVYSKDDAVIIAVSPTDGDIFNKDTLSLINKLTQNAWQVPYSGRVDSLTNFQNTIAIEDDLYVRDLMKDGDTLDAAQIKHIRKVALTDPLLVGQAVAKDGRATGITIRVNLPGDSITETPEVVAYVRNMVAQLKAEYPNHNFYYSGMIMMNNAFNDASMKDMTTLVPLMYLILIIITAFFLKSFVGTLATLAVLLSSVIAGMGVAGYLGIPITPPSSVAPTIILTLAIADSIHILKSIFGLMKKGMEKQQAIIEGLRLNLQPVFLTSLTTAIGFLSLNMAETPPLHDLGNITAAGVIFAFIFSITFIPAIISFCPVKIKVVTEEKASNSFFIKLSHFIAAHKIKIIIATAIVTALSVYQASKIQLNDSFVKYFSKDIEFRTHSDWITKNLAGVYQVEFDLKSGESQGISDPAYLKTVDDFSNMYRGIKDVTHVNTITDTFRRLNKSMHGDDPAFYTLPENRELAAQYLLLYEMSLPYGLDLNNQIDVDKSSTRVVVTFTDVDTTRMIEITDIGEAWLKNNAPAYMHTIGASPTVMFSHITHNNVKSMFWGTLLAFLLITITMAIALKSVKFGLISLLPNMIPAVMALGAWSLFVGQAGFALSVVFAVTLGIVVDDTVHFLSKYVRAKREKNLSVLDAVQDSFSNVGSALIATSIILICGFAVLTLSSFKMNFVLGSLSAMTIAIALFIDFTFLPALLLAIDKKEEK